MSDVAPDRLHLLARLGVYVDPAFLPLPVCRALVADARHRPRAPGTVVRHGASVVDREVKRLAQVFMPETAADDLLARLDATAPRLAAHFGTPLTGHEGVSFYRYGEGDSYAPHRDSHGELDEAAFGHRRQASLVLFLNDPDGLAGEPYTGGDLVLYDVVGQGPLAEYGVAVPAAAGLLVAFRPHLLHEVTPVTGGARWVAVSRFY